MFALGQTHECLHEGGFPLKYWRGFLIAGILAAITVALTQFAATHSALVDMIYPYSTRLVVSFLADWSAGLEACLWQILALLLGLGVLASIVLMIVLRWNPIQWAGWVLAVASFIWMFHTAIYGLNYYAGPLADDVRLEVSEYSVSQLAAATEFYLNEANALADQVTRDESGKVAFATFEELAEQAGDGFRTLTFEKNYSLAVFAGPVNPVKKLGWSDLYTSMGISGVTIAMTGEAAVNPNIPVVSMPFTMCHEMAHRMSIATEQDANFAAFLACDANSSVEFRYSAYFMAFRYCYNALAAMPISTAQTTAAKLKAAINTNLQTDLDDYRQYLDTQLDADATKLANDANDAYLKNSGDEQGTASYGAVTDLLVSWHVQEYVLPQYTPEEEEMFDPFDENQVDLSGWVTAQ